MEKRVEWRERSTDTSDKQNVGNVTMYSVDQRFRVKYSRVQTHVIHEFY